MVLSNSQHIFLQYRPFSKYTEETLIPGFYWFANRNKEPMIGDEQEKDKMIRIINFTTAYGAGGGFIKLKPTDLIAGPVPTPIHSLDQIHGPSVARSNTCPECGQEAVQTCKCPRGDSKCANGHEWHRCVVHKVVVRGGSDHSRPTDYCTCLQGSEEGQRSI